ncbi:MAG: hypothetical protein V3W20_07035 [Candidatus Neomarinimicrobiota bacterium]
MSDVGKKVQFIVGKTKLEGIIDDIIYNQGEIETIIIKSCDRIFEISQSQILSIK